MFRTTVVNSVVAAVALGLAAAPAEAQSTVKIGVLLPMTGGLHGFAVGEIFVSLREYVRR